MTITSAYCQNFKRFTIKNGFQWNQEFLKIFSIACS